MVMQHGNKILVSSVVSVNLNVLIKQQNAFNMKATSHQILLKLTESLAVLRE